MARRNRKRSSERTTPRPSLKKTALPQPDPVRWEAGFWKRHLIPAAILLVLPFVLYFPTTGYQYVLDDQIVITDNSYTKQGLKGLWPILTTESMQGYFGEQKNVVAGNRYRPLSIMTFAVEHELFATEYTNNEGQTLTVPDPAVTHFNNILFYALTILLIFRIFSLLLPHNNPAWWFGTAFLAALLFTLHPVHVEAVANVKGRDEILVMLLSLSTLYLGIRYGSTGKITTLLLGGIAFFLALLAKENAVTFLAVIPLTLFVFTPISIKRNVITTGVLVAFFVGYLLLRLSVVGSFFNPASNDLLNNPFVEMNMAEKLATIQYTLLDYLRLLVFPHPLTHDYYPYHIPIMQWTDWQVVLSVLLYLGLGIIAVVQFRKRTIVSWSILFFFFTISIISNIVFPVGVFMNERFLFMPSLAYCVLAGWGLSVWLPKRLGRPGKIAGVALLVAMVAGYALRTITRVPVWESPLTLNQAAVKVSKNSTRANCFIGTALYHEYRGLVADGKSQEARPLLDKAHEHIKRSLEIHPTYYSALTMKGGIAAERYQFDRNLNALLQEFYEIIVIKKRVQFIDEYIEYLFGGRADKATMTDFIHRVAFEHFLMNARSAEDYSYAAHYLNMGIKAVPNDARLLYDLSQVYQAAGNTEKAQEYLGKARTINPSVGTSN